MAQPVDVTISGEALDDLGLCAYNTIEGLGLNTFGFLWPCDGIWAPAFPPVTTVWTTFQDSTNTIESCLDKY